MIKNAKRFAIANNVSLSRMIEFLLQKVSSSSYSILEDFPTSDWVHQLTEGKRFIKQKQGAVNNLEKNFF